MIRTLILLHHLENARGELVARGLWDHDRPNNIHNAHWRQHCWDADELIARLRGVRSHANASEISQAKAEAQSG